MGLKIRYILFFIIPGIVLAGCRKPYTPPAVASPNNYLVVEGVINNGGDSTVISLSKTVNITDTPSLKPEVGASVTVEGEDGENHQLNEFKNGRYLALSLSLSLTKKYKLHIIAGNNEYASDYFVVKPNPPIDSVTYRVTPKGLQINANTHDATNKTRYYRWAYEEAWRFHSQRNSESVVKGTQIVQRTPDEQIYYCFAGDRSSHIVLASSVKLQQDVISQSPVTLIPPYSEKIQLKYSILLKQYAVTKEEYEFWENIRKNTEQLGSIFDAQPSQLKGNIHNLNNPNEPVIGYASATNVQTKRIYVASDNFPDNYFPVYDNQCDVVKAIGNGDVNFYVFQLHYIPLKPITDKFNHIIGYETAPIECTDCRLRGHIDAPDFWEL
jgi:hypothetical protein